MNGTVIGKNCRVDKSIISEYVEIADQVTLGAFEEVENKVAPKIYKAGVECEASLENMMACGLGACLCCVEKTTEGNLCVCKEGPVLNIKKLLWQL